MSDKLLKAVKAIMPSNICLTNSNVRYIASIPLDIPYQELRNLQDAINEAEQQPSHFEIITDAITEFFEGEYFVIGKVVDGSKVRGDQQVDSAEEYPPFDKIFVEQGGGGITGDDFHGTAFFHLGNDRWATAEY